LIHLVFLLVAACSSASGSPPSWFSSPPESEEYFYFLTHSTSDVKEQAQSDAKRNVVIQASSYLGEYFDRKNLEFIKEGYHKDIKTNILTCYLLSKYPRSLTSEAEFIEEWNVKEINKFFIKEVKKIKKLSFRDRIIEAIREISYAASDKRLPDVKKEELSNMLKDLVTRVKITPLDYSKTADTKSGMRGEIGALVSVMGREQKPVSGLKIEFAFLKNSGFMDKKHSLTDAKGLVAVKVMRINNPGAATISARILNETVPEFSMVQPALFDVTVQGERLPILKRALPFARGASKKQNIVLLTDNLPVGILAVDFILRPTELEGVAKIIPTHEISGFSIDNQVNVEGVELEEVTQSTKLGVEKAEEMKEYSIKVKPFEICIYLTKINREKITHPLQGEIETIKNLIVNFIIYYL